ncbi:MAG: TetR/AcrR family transcriptional regulator [Actinomycetota bacterium]|nr:TetR/AcrR family transcriptional regulator [Actinomycetota bacterium]
MTSRQLQAVETQKRIYEVTKQLVDTYGIDGVSIRGIAEGADVSVGTFYHYYNSKDEVIYSMLIYIKQRFLDELKLNLSGVTYTDKIFTLIISDLNFMKDYIDSYKTTIRRILKNRSSDYVFSDYLFSDFNPTFMALRELLTTAKESGEISKDIEVNDVCVMLQTMIWGLVDLQNVSSEFDLIGTARAITKVVLTSLQ